VVAQPLDQGVEAQPRGGGDQDVAPLRAKGEDVLEDEAFVEQPVEP